MAYFTAKNIRRMPPRKHACQSSASFHAHLELGLSCFTWEERNGLTKNAFSSRCSSSAPLSVCFRLKHFITSVSSSSNDGISKLLRNLYQVFTSIFPRPGGYDAEAFKSFVLPLNCFLPFGRILVVARVAWGPLHLHSLSIFSSHGLGLSKRYIFL